MLVTGAFRRAAHVVLSLCVLVLVTLGLQVHGGNRATWLDRDIRDALPEDNRVLEMFADLGNAGVAAVLVGIVAVSALLLRRPAVAVLVVTAPPVAILIELALKPVFDRTKGSEFAYPSGHATAVTAIVVAALLLSPEIYRGALRAAVRLALAAVPVLTSIGLVTEDYHYATDTVGGMCLGLFVTVGLALVLDAVIRPTSRGASSAR